MASKNLWKRFVRFVAQDGRELCGEPIDETIDVGVAVSENKDVLVRVLSCTSPLEKGNFTGETALIRKLLSPLSPDEVGTIRCIGLNFKDHAAELRLPLPAIPEVFMKPSQCINNPLDPITLPSSACGAIDAEVELAIVLGKTCKNTTVSRAMDYVLGFTAANDLTARDVQGQTSQWGYCKGYDGFCPLGPVLVSTTALSDPTNLDMKTVLNGDVLQNGSTREFIFSVAEIISHLSKDTTLPKGTVILTGTPSGIGHSYTPPQYLKAGSVVRVSISGGIGTLASTVVSEDCNIVAML